MNPSYRNSAPLVTPSTAEMPLLLEQMCRIKLSEVFQAVLESEVDAALERLRYERQSGDTNVGHRDGHDRPRSIASNRGPIEIRRPRVRGVAFRSEALQKHRRRLKASTGASQTFGLMVLQHATSRECCARF
jgi:transposase-like protein